MGSADDMYRAALAAATSSPQRRYDGDPRVMLTALHEAAARGDVPADEFDVALLLTESLRAMDDLDYASLVDLVARTDALLARIGADHPQFGLLTLAAVSLRSMAELTRADPDVWSHPTSGRRPALAAEVAPDNPFQRIGVLMDLHTELTRRMMAALSDPDGPDRPPTDDEVIRLRRLTALNPGVGAAPQGALFAAVAVMIMVQIEDRPGIATAAINDLKTALRLAPPDEPYRPYYRRLLGNALIRRAEATLAAASYPEAFLIRPSPRPRAAAIRDLDRGIATLEQALDEAQTPAFPLWAGTALALADGYRRTDRLADARRVGLQALRGHAWAVLLQSTTAAASTATNMVAEDAVRIAGWCVADGDAVGAAAALDAGRGLILYAATEVEDVPAKLTAVGATDLAGRWPSGPADLIPTPLRREAFERLTMDGTLLDPPSADETRSALRAAGAGALVYLLAARDAEPARAPTGAAAQAARPGAAVVIPADGPAVVHPLPELTVPPHPVGGEGGRELGVAGPPQPPDALESLCDWAWRVAVGPLLDVLPDRVILVPMGELAGVPWHAARHQVPDKQTADEQTADVAGSARRYVYAVERMVISYAASARLFCRGSRPVLDGPMLIVGDPDSAGAADDLLGARREALALHERHPEARYVGRLADGSPSPAGAGDPDDVLAFSGGVLHLACHGVVRAGLGTDDTSYLLLAGGQRLAAERLVAARGRPRPGLVVLAACSSGVSGRGWDEAFSISTAFLAGGSAAVVAAQWSVPDEATSTLMLSFHRHLDRLGGSAADALRAAQIDMIRAAEHPRSWAGFVHFGR
ncbi:CHAT domain-containing protein [Solwaraspora sp. WMMB335]|uniref:CHAT domain-containing protein n=1 Tax=Solwaraspora sp. WMMB335 TaxID=3404118 RepID=UPI003B92672C